jgi:hypothetical protein
MFRAEQLYEEQKEEDRIFNLEEKDDDGDVVEERIEKDESSPGKTPTSYYSSTQMKKK